MKLKGKEFNSISLLVWSKRTEAHLLVTTKFASRPVVAEVIFILIFFFITTNDLSTPEHVVTPSIESSRITVLVELSKYAWIVSLLTEASVLASKDLPGSKELRREVLAAQVFGAVQSVDVADFLKVKVF